jgi:hypothetical protein
MIATAAPSWSLVSTMISFPAWTISDHWPPIGCSMRCHETMKSFQVSSQSLVAMTGSANSYHFRRIGFNSLPVACGMMFFKRRANSNILRFRSP